MLSCRPFRARSSREGTAACNLMEGTRMSQPPERNATAPPGTIYIIRHGEKPADPPAVAHGQAPPASCPAFWGRLPGQSGPAFPAAQGLAALRCARRPFCSCPRGAASRTAKPGDPALTLLRQPGQDGRAADVSDDPGSQRPPRDRDRLLLRRGPGTPARRERGEQLRRRRAHLLGARPHPVARLVAAHRAGNRHPASLARRSFRCHLDVHAHPGRSLAPVHLRPSSAAIAVRRRQHDHPAVIGAELGA